MRSMYNLTTEERRALHKEMWEWVAAEPGRLKTDWPEWYEFHSGEAFHFAHCFACAEAEVVFDKKHKAFPDEDINTCIHCPIWTAEVPCLSAEYDQYCTAVNAKNLTEVQRLALIIANLPFRDPREEEPTDEQPKQ